MTALPTWLQLSDDLLSHAWGTMDRYHLAWLMVGKPKGIVRGRPMTPDEEAGYVREVVSQKTAALRMSLDAVERQGMPFVGETGGVGPGRGTGEVAAEAPATGDGSGSRRSIPLDPEMQRRLDEARQRGLRAHDARRRRAAPRRPAGRLGRSASSGDRRSRAHHRRRGNPRRPGPGCRRPRLHPPRAAPRPAPARDRRRLLRAGRRSRPRSTWSSSGAPARLADDAAALRGRLAGEVADAATGATGWTSSWSRSRRWPGCGPARRSRTSSRSRGASR